MVSGSRSFRKTSSLSYRSRRISTRRSYNSGIKVSDATAPASQITPPRPPSHTRSLVLHRHATLSIPVTGTYKWNGWMDGC